MIKTIALLSATFLSLTSAGIAADFYVGGEPSVPTLLPAVSGVNGKLALQGGSFDEEGFGVATGSISLPLGTSFGFQADGLAGVRDGDFVGGIAGHLFWRDPAFGLLGAYGSYVRRDDIDADISRLAIEGEYYWNQWSVEAIIGAEFLDADNAIVADDTNFFDFVDVSYYATEDLKLSVGHRYTGERHAAALGVEYQLQQTVFDQGVSLFAEGRIGEEDYKGIWAGARIYLGDNKSLIRRHREDDPRNRLTDDLIDLEVEAVAPIVSGRMLN